jgi:superkiller protein 3
LGIGLLQTADFQGAIAAFRDAILFAPYWLYAHHNLALALTQAGEYDEAIRTYRAAMALVPRYSYIPYNLGLLYQQLNRPAEAREAWQQALALSPDLARAWNAIGLSYFLEGRLDKAEDGYRSALNRAKRQTDRLAIRHDLALLLARRGQPDEAIRYWRLNTAEAPDDLPSLIGLSDILVARGRTAEALRTLSSIVRQKPEYAGARLQYAKTLFKAGQFAAAAEQAQAILGHGTENPDAYELLADLQVEARTKSTAELSLATDLYRRALQLSGSSEQRNRVRRKLKNLGSRVS